MGWFSSRKGVSKEEFKGLISSIKGSFTNVRKDFSSIKTKTQQNEEDLKELQNIIGYLDQSIKILNNKIDSLELNQPKQDIDTISKERVYEEKIPKKSQNKNKILSKITQVQEEILKKLAALNRESPSEVIAAKDLALEMYPESEYSKVRPMISNYLDILEELGLVKKIRKRRQVYVELTKQGESLIEPQTKIKLSRTKRK